MARRNISTFSRRGFLRGAGAIGAATGVGLPLLNGLMARAAVDPGRARRVIFFFVPNEPIDRAHWLPPGNGNEFALTQMPSEMVSLEPYMDQLLMIGDLELSSRLDDPHPGGHIGMTHLLTGRRVTPTGPGEGEHWASGTSLDHYIAQQLGVDALVLGARVNGNNGNARFSYLGDSQPVAPVNDPQVAFENIFAEGLLPADELATRKAQRLSVLDRVSGDLARLESRLPAEGRNKLQIHTEMIRELELKIESDQSFDCDPISPSGGVSYNTNENYPLAIRRQIDVMVQALGCGITDVAGLQLGNSGAAGVTPTWPDEGININVDYHNIAHDYNGDITATIRDRREQAEAFFYRMFAYLLEQLRAVPEGDGTTMLDNSLVLWMRPIGYKHRVTEMLFMLAGSANGQLNTGRFVSRPGQPHNNLLVNICNLMGLDDTSYGDSKYCTGPLALG